MTNKNFSDDSFDKIFDVTPLRNSIKNNSIAKYILFFFY